MSKPCLFLVLVLRLGGSIWGVRSMRKDFSEVETSSALNKTGLEKEATSLQPLSEADISLDCKKWYKGMPNIFRSEWRQAYLKTDPCSIKVHENMKCCKGKCIFKAFSDGGETFQGCPALGQPAAITPEQSTNRLAGEGGEVYASLLEAVCREPRLCQNCVFLTHKADSGEDSAPQCVGSAKSTCESCNSFLKLVKRSPDRAAILRQLGGKKSESEVCGDQRFCKWEGVFGCSYSVVCTWREGGCVPQQSAQPCDYAFADSGSNHSGCQCL